jgi:transportin-1
MKTYFFINKHLIRSITCWTLGRYAEWISNPHVVSGQNLNEHLQKYMVPMLQGILHLCLDPIKQVQKSACSSLATLEEEAREKLVPYLGPIVETISKAFKIYQIKNMLILYDAVGILAEFVGSALAQPALLEKLMPPLIDQWSNLADDNFDLFPLFEVVSFLKLVSFLSFYCSWSCFFVICTTYLG